MFKFIFYLGLLFSVEAMLGQQREFIRCRLTNEQTQKPIPFASIQLKNKKIGLISNLDGGFKIPLEYKIAGDTLFLSCIGYTSKEVVVSNLSENRINTLYLVEDTVILDEVVVTASKKRKKLTAKEIIRLAIRKIPENYPTKPFSYVGYYRDYQLKEGNYLNLNEAILAIFDSGFTTNDLKDTKIRLYTYEENENFTKDSISSQTYDYFNKRKIIPNATISGRIRNEHTRLRLHDAIRNHDIYTYSFVDRFDIDFVKNHKFSLGPDTSIDEVPLFKIKISKVLDKVHIMGKIYIDKTNFGIYKLEYSVYEKKPSKYRKEPFSRTGILTAQKGRFGKLVYDITVEYKRVQDKMYLNYISFSNAFDILPPPKFTPVSAKIDQDKRRFELVLNNAPLVEDALNTENYNLYYQERKSGLDRIEVNGNSVFLYPKNADVVFDKNLVLFFKERNKTGVAIEIKNVRDLSGNIINESEATNYNQFREFFVQELSTKTKAPEDKLYLIKTIPLNENQPFVPNTDLSDFWMNTPLKN